MTACPSNITHYVITAGVGLEINIPLSFHNKILIYQIRQRCNFAILENKMEKNERNLNVYVRVYM